MEALTVSKEFEEKHGVLMNTVAEEMGKLINDGDTVLLHEFIQSITFIMENSQKRIKVEYLNTPEALIQDKGWSC